MADEKDSEIPKKLSSKRWVLVALGITFFLIVAFVFIIVFYGMFAADPRGESIFPGP